MIIRWLIFLTSWMIKLWQFLCLTDNNYDDVFAMQPTSEKKKKILSMKFNFSSSLVYGKGEKREAFPQKVPSCVMGEIAKNSRETQRENVTGALITPEINHRHYNINGMSPDIMRYCIRYEQKHSPLPICGALFLHPLLSLPRNIDQSFCACEYFVCFSPHVRFLKCLYYLMLSSPAHIIMLRRTPFSSPYRYFTHNIRFSGWDKE